MDQMDLDTDFCDPVWEDQMDLDSDFYGDDDTKSRLKARVSAFDTEAGVQELILTMPSRSKNQTRSLATGHLHNPYAGNPYAWQLDETVDTFLARVPPSTTILPSEQWIWICNPFTPPDSHRMVEGFYQGGMARLHLLSEFISKTKEMARSKLAASREITKERAQAVTQILDLAHHLNVRCGKWMLFPEPRVVDEVWGVVARATAANELGMAAKVAPKDPGEGQLGAARLICVYTRDFRDKDDVGRVLTRLRELGLVRVNARPIYYKCDAYTYLGIGSQNAWDIKASLYSSTEIFDYMKNREGARARG